MRPTMNRACTTEVSEAVLAAMKMTHSTERKALAWVFSSVLKSDQDRCREVENTTEGKPGAREAPHIGPWTVNWTRPKLG